MVIAESGGLRASSRSGLTIGPPLIEPVNAAPRGSAGEPSCISAGGLNAVMSPEPESVGTPSVQSRQSNLQMMIMVS